MPTNSCADCRSTAHDGRDKSNVEYGGVGYGNATRPDLSNTAFLIDALKASGSGGRRRSAVKRRWSSSPAARTWRSEHNTTPFAAKNPDGGFYYTPAAGGQNPSRRTAEGGLRSYGSMTYAGLKSMIFAGVGPDDPRVKAALKWIQQNYDLDKQSRHGQRRLVLLLPHCSPKRWTRWATTKSKTPTANRTTGAAN